MNELFLRAVEAGSSAARAALLDEACMGDPHVWRSVEALSRAHDQSGDLLMRALEKDRTRRHETASGRARDIERFLESDPVEAGPPSATYRLRKFARKHRPALFTAGGFAALLMLGAAVSAWQAIRAVAAPAHARAGVDKAKRSAEDAEAVLDFLLDQVLAAARPEGQEGGLGREVAIHKAVDAAEPLIAEAFKDKPAVEASIRGTLGIAYVYLGKPLILAGYEGLKARAASILPQGRQRLPEAAQRVVKLYQARRKPEKAADRRKRLGLAKERPHNVFQPE